MSADPIRPAGQRHPQALLAGTATGEAGNQAKEGD